MPVCTVCAYPAADYLYTTYKTKSNIRLGVCAKCGEFLDPLVEHPPLLLLLDLILLKPRIYLHLLFNRGSRPYDVDCEAPAARRKQERTDQVTSDFTNLALATLAAETATRLQARNVFTNNEAGDVAKMLGVVLLESTVQHVVTTILALAVLRWKGWYPKRYSGRRGDYDGRQEYFSPIMISLILFYTTLLPLILQLVLSIWYTHEPPNVDTRLFDLKVPSLLVGFVSDHTVESLCTFFNETASMWRRTDRIWAGTKLLGGMSAGFGLRVILPTKPWETTAIVLAGWGAASMAGRAFDYA